MNHYRRKKPRGAWRPTPKPERVVYCMGIPAFSGSTAPLTRSELAELVNRKVRRK